MNLTYKPHTYTPIALGIAAVSIGFAIFQHIQIQNLTSQLDEKTRTTQTYTIKLTAAQKSISDNQLSLDAASKQITDLTSASKDYQEKIDAFAKQARACESIKTRFHIK